MSLTDLSTPPKEASAPTPQMPEISASERLLPQLALTRRIAVLVLLLSILVVGSIASLSIPLEMLPRGFEPSMMTILANWQQAPSQEVLEKVTKPLEEELSTVPGLQNTFSTSNTGRARLRLAFKSGVDMDVAYREVRDRLERAKARMPDDLDRVQIRKADDSDIPVYAFGITVDPEIEDPWHLIQNEIVTPIQRIDGVAGIAVNGLVQKEVLIELDRERIRLADGGSASLQVCDIRQEDAVKRTVADVLAARGRIDGLVNNAGGQYITPLASISAKGWQAVIDTNLTGGFLMARECYLQSMQDHGGSIVNIVADIWGSMPGMGHSGAARAGMVSLTETAALEWAKSGVRVNAVAPGYIASSGMDHYPPEAGPMLREMRETVPLGRFGNEAETSAAIVFLLSPAASFISGTVMRVDGARPQVRMGWGQVAAPDDVQQRDAVKPFDGFHRYQTPKVFQK